MQKLTEIRKKSMKIVDISNELLVVYAIKLCIIFGLEAQK